jgi:hypothetical protein
VVIRDPRRRKSTSRLEGHLTPPVRALVSTIGMLAVAICCLAWVSVAGAAAPVNDDFDGRLELSDSLPIEVAGANEGATKEVGEPNHNGFSAAGHSIWYEWEATGTGWVTIGVCDSDFRAVVGIYTGTSVDALTRVVSGNASEGPNCPYSSSEFTFKASSGTNYKIAVDGDSFYIPPAPPPVTEGEIALRIEATPLPPNDDFANATTLEAPIGEEPGGDRFYFVNSFGYNWTATTEAGEPIDGTPSGASVWYSWTAPESGWYRFSGPCCVTGLNWGLYRGDTLDQLEPALAATGFAEAAVTAGTNYRILVYGTPDLDTGEPTMGSFGFSISASLPPLRPVLPLPSGSRGGAPPDLFAPQTGISKRVLKRRPPMLTLRFRSSEAGSTFRCRLDNYPFAVCGFSRTYRNLNPGFHKFEVFAVDEAGNKDPTPAVARFRVPKSKSHKGKI